MLDEASQEVVRVYKTDEFEAILQHWCGEDALVGQHLMVDDADW